MIINATDYSSQELIKLIREWTELTQEDFAKSIGTTRKIIRNYEQGITDVKIDTLLDIAKIHNLKITIEKD